VRKMAAERGYKKVSEKKDSLGACFCAGDYRPFLKNQLVEPDKFIFPGSFIDENGNHLGNHAGFPLYTVGQRRGLIHLNRKVFVKQIRPESNEVVLAPIANMYKTEFSIRAVNVVDKGFFTDQFNVNCRIRYRKQNTLCRVKFLENDTAIVELAEPLESIAPGQSAVFYSAGKVLGGGFIE